MKKYPVESVRATFWIETPQQMLEKLRYELTAYHQIPSFNMVERTYLMINCANTAWHMTEWVWKEAEKRGNLQLIRDYMGREIGGCKQFGDALVKSMPFFDMCYHVATSTKHAEVSNHPNPSIKTIIEKDRYQDELWVTFNDWQIPIVEMLNYVYSFWKDLIARCNLLDSYFSPDGDSASNSAQGIFEMKRVDSF